MEKLILMLHSTNITSAFSAYLNSHLRNCIACLGDIWRAPWESLLISLVVGIALALPTSFITLVLNLHRLAPNFANTTQISAFFVQKTDISANNVKHKINNFVNRKDLHIINHKLLSPADALHEFEQTTGQQNILYYLEENPLPAVLVLNLAPNTSAQDAQAIVQELKQWIEIAEVKLDIAWLNKILAFLQLLKYLALTLGTILTTSVIFIIGNTIKLAIADKKENIQIAKLIGATNAFIRREFLYLGLWYGLFGSIVAWIIIWASILILQKPVSQIATLYQTKFTLISLPAIGIVILLVSGILLGVTGAWVAVNNYVNRVTA